jgi:hypothetical protein
MMWPVYEEEKGEGKWTGNGKDVDLKGEKYVW